MIVLITALLSLAAGVTAPSPAIAPGRATPASAGLAPVGRTTVAPPAAQATPLTPAAPAAVAQGWALDAKRSTLTFHVEHKLHHVSGASHGLEGKAALLPDGTLQIMVRAPISTFDSADANRDSHMREVLEAAKFPLVSFKGVAKVALPTTFPAKVSTTIEGQLDFHGRRLAESVPMTLEFTSANEVHATGTLNVSLDRYEVERPSLLLMKIDDTCRIELDVTARTEAR